MANLQTSAPTISEIILIKRETEKRINDFVTSQMKEFKEQTGISNFSLNVSTHVIYVEAMRDPIDIVFETKIESSI